MKKTEWFETYMLEKTIKKCSKLYHYVWEELTDVHDILDDIAKNDLFFAVGKNNCKYLVCAYYDWDYDNHVVVKEHYAIPWDFDGDIVEPEDCKRLFDF